MQEYKFIVQEQAGIVYEYAIPVVMADNLACKQARAFKLAREVMSRLSCLGCSEKLIALHRKVSKQAIDYKAYCIAYAQQYPLR